MKSRIIIFIIFLLIMLNLIVSITYATENTIPSYDFYIKDSQVILNDKHNILISEVLDNKTLTNNKIAPGTSGKFNIKIYNEINSKYNLKFTNFTEEFPQNIKFFFNDEEINIKTFSLIDIQNPKETTYQFSWKWEYDTNGKDFEDIIASKIDNLGFDIELVAEYYNIQNEYKLPRSGDI